MQDWFTAGGSQSYVYNSTWKTLTGYPSEFGADNQINDHNFHAGYAIMGAAIVAQYDSVWAANENWGGMVELLIKDGNNYDRNDTRFPFLRALILMQVIRGNQVTEILVMEIMKSPVLNQ